MRTLRIIAVALSCAALAIIVSGCGSGDKADGSALPPVVTGPTGAALKKAMKTPKNASPQTEEQIAKAIDKASKSTPEMSSRKALEDHIKLLQKVRKVCRQQVEKTSKGAVSEKKAALERCDSTFKASVSTFKKQQAIARTAYEKCLKKASQMKDAAARQKVLIGCASIPH